jgi:tetratricopeptide (TPR) repeat protein
MKLNPIGATAVLISLILLGCRRGETVPEVGSDKYRELCSAFYLGLAALQSGEDVNARTGLTSATQIAPGEPAVWVNLGLLQARQQEYEAAYANFEKARALAPSNSHIETFLGIVESRRGNLPAALAHYRRAVDLDSANLRALYTLAVETERQQTGGSAQEALGLLERILKVRPQNEPVQLDVIRLSAKLNNAARARQAVSALGIGATNWPEAANEHFTQLRQAVTKGELRDAAIQSQFLRNTLVRELIFRRSLEEIRAPGASVGEPFPRFLKLPSPKSHPSPSDKELGFESRPLQSISDHNPAWVGALSLDEDGGSAILWANAGAMHVEEGSTLALPGKPRFRKQQGLGQDNVAAADLNYDFKPDLVFATAEGLRVYQQGDRRQFVDVTAKTRLPAAVTQGSYTGAWPTDFDLDGDLDVLLGSTQGNPRVIRNNGDGTFVPVVPFNGVNGVVSFSNADIDADGVPDAAFVDSANKLIIFINERLGVYKQRPLPSQIADQNRAIAAGDVNGDGLIDFVVLRMDGSVVRLSDKDYGKAWESAEFARVSPVAQSTEGVNLRLADLDNNGGIDLIAGDQVVLADQHGFTPLGAKLPGKYGSLVDLNQDGRLDLVGLSPDGRPVQLVSYGTKNYKWQVIRTKAATVMGDQRMNSFGIGGEIEIRSGLLTQKQMILSPILHFGLGEHLGVEFARIVWPNGIIQAEFALQAQQSVLAQQRLKGSCPFLFTWDGHQMRFLKDVAPMSAPIGAHHDANTLEPVGQTQQWFKIAGDQLVSRDGYYDVRLTNEYWETHYIDFYSLLVVDHPAGSHVFIDERVASPAAPLHTYLTETPQAFSSATDDTGRDVASVIRAVDENYLAGFGVGQYQGLTRDHWVELQLPSEAPGTGSLYLIGDGFIRPWDDTITIARSQRTNLKPEGLRIEVPDAAGNWRIVKDHLGMPAGRLKTVVLDLNGIFRPGAPRKLRLRTNMEVYWDRLSWAAGLTSEGVRIQTTRLSHAELRYRGFSLITQVGQTSPELAHYDNVVRTGEQWRSLEGYYTRYGDVKPLLASIDDRIVIANSGDELRLRFEAAPPRDESWSRDYIFIGDGWIKEGDYNFRLSKTVLPLPYHGMKSYNLPLTPLEQDKLYQRHASDWQDFHTRYLTSEHLVRALWK